MVGWAPLPPNGAPAAAALAVDADRSGATRGNTAQGVDGISAIFVTDLRQTLRKLRPIHTVLAVVDVEVTLRLSVELAPARSHAFEVLAAADVGATFLSSRRNTATSAGARDTTTRACSARRVRDARRTTGVRRPTCGCRSADAPGTWERQLVALARGSEGLMVLRLKSGYPADDAVREDVVLERQG